MTSKIYAEITFKSWISNLDDITDITGLISSDQHHIGDISVTSKLLNYSQWSFCTETIETFDTNDAINILFYYLKKNWNSIKRYIKHKECETSICIIIKEAGEVLPALGISSKNVKLASQLNARIDFDGI